MLVPLSPQKTSPLLSQFLRHLRRRGQNAQQGLTIMECLVAIMLIGLTVSMVTPPLLIATASRVQTRRGEQAQQLAQDEVDRINTMVQRGLHQNSLLPVDAGTTSPKNVPAPTAFAGVLRTTRSPTAPCAKPRFSEQTPIPANQALPIDVDGDCNPDFFMQTFRLNSQYTIAETRKADKKPARFDLGVRVYSSLVETNGTLASGQLKSDPAASLGLTIGQGQQATNPLSIIYKGISWGERSEVLCQYTTTANRSQLAGCN